MKEFPREAFFIAFAQIKSMPKKEVQLMFAEATDEELRAEALKNQLKLRRVGFDYASFT